MGAFDGSATLSTVTAALVYSAAIAAADSGACQSIAHLLLECSTRARGSACRPNRNGSLAVSACAPERSGYCVCRHGHFTRKLTYAVAAVRPDSIRRRVLNTVQRCLVVTSYVHTVSLAAQAHLCVGTVAAHRLSRQLDALHCKVGQPWWPHL